jgi:hypothetical protein
MQSAFIKLSTQLHRTRGFYYYSADYFDLLREGRIGYKINHPIPS